MSIATTEAIIAELRAGRMVILIDEEHRENEGDLVLAADFVTPEAINFMIKYGRGLVCLTLTEEHCDRLNLTMMSTHNNTRFGTNFTVSIEAAVGITTGISAADRAHTIQVAIAKTGTVADIVKPGHIFPLRAKKGGVLTRAGHTEAGCDLTQLGGLTSAAVICEILKEDGTMARLPDLLTFSKIHKIKIGKITDLIFYRNLHENIIKRIAERTMHTIYGYFKVIMYRDIFKNSIHLALVHGDIHPSKETLVRMHKPLSIFDFLDTQSTAQSWNIASAISVIKSAKRGVVILLNCQESTEQIFTQCATFNSVCTIQPSYIDNIDLCTYGICAQILKNLNVHKMRLLENPCKVHTITNFNLEVTGYCVNSSINIK